MFGFIRSTSFLTQAMIPILGLTLFGIAWYFPGNLGHGNIYGNGFFYIPSSGLLYSLWLGMARLPLWAQMVPSCLITILTAGLLVRTDLKDLLMGSRSYAIAYVFLFLVTSNGHSFLFHPAMLSGYFMVLSYRFLLDLYKEETGYSLVFTMGCTWGIAILMYPPIGLITPALLTGLLLMINTVWRHWLVGLLGIILPALLVAFVLFMTGGLENEVYAFLSWFELRPDLIPEFILKEPFIAAWLGLILIWTVIASINYRNPRIQSRKLFQANFILFVSILFMTAFLETVSVEVLWILVIPVSYLMTFWALRVQKGWLRDLFLLSLLLFFSFFRLVSRI